jgi:hypothetical protein
MLIAKLATRLSIVSYTYSHREERLLSMMFLSRLGDTKFERMYSFTGC